MDNLSKRLLAHPIVNRKLILLGQACLAVLWLGTAQGQSLLQPYAQAGYQYDSNLFALPTDAALFGFPQGMKLADQTYSALGGVHADFRWPLDEFTMDAEGRRFDYDNNGYLDHNEYLLSGKFAWTTAGILGGTVAVRQEQTLEAFAQQVSTVVALQTDRYADLSVRFGLSPRWSLNLDVRPHERDAPQPDLPNFRLRETTSTLSLAWQVVSKLTIGADGLYVQGGYYGGLAPLPYRQNSQDVTFKYVATGLSTFNASIGRSNFETAPTQGGSISATTGTLSYTRSLTGKTAVTLQVTRGLNTYIAAGNAELDTSVRAEIDWAATRKIAVQLTASETHSVFSGTPAITVYPIGLTEHYFTGQLLLKYQATQWLSARLYGQYQKRNSNSAYFTFDDQTVGLQLRAQLGPAAP